MIEVQLLQDESSNWYIVPNDKAEEFHELMEKVIENDYDFDLIKSFEEKFNKYRTGGGPNNYQLHISEEEMKNLTGE